MRLAGLIGTSKAMCALIEQIRRYAAADSNVLISGETGVGKDACARALHVAGPRRLHPFVKIDCPGLPATLVEAELFGYVRGAFTDAAGAKAGRFELAGRGTVYLDNVSELPLEAQAKLLRLVEDKQVERLGGITSMRLDARIVASTGAQIDEAVRDGVFRSDLFHRLRVLPLRISPLRERRADILPLARLFLREIPRKLGRPPVTLTSAAAAALEAYAWPGNARELQYTLEHAVLSMESPHIGGLDVSDLPNHVLDHPSVYYGVDAPKRLTLEEVERRYIDGTLREAGGNQTKAARMLGISRKTLWEKRKRYGLK